MNELSHDALSGGVENSLNSPLLSRGTFCVLIKLGIDCIHSSHKVEGLHSPAVFSPFSRFIKFLIHLRIVMIGGGLI